MWRTDTPAARHVSLGAGAEIMRQLASVPGPHNLLDTMTALARTHAPGAEVYLLAPDAIDPLSGLVPILSGNSPHLVEIDGRHCLFAQIAAGGATHGVLCAAQDSAPSQSAIELLTLIAAFGASLLDQRKTMAAMQDEIVALHSEVNARMALAAHLVDERSLLRTIIDKMPDHIYVKDSSGRFIIGNKAAADGIGVASPDDLVGKSDLEFYPVECGQRFFTDEQQIIRSGQSIVDQVEENINQHGVRRWFSTTKVPLRDAEGNPIGIIGMSRDVTLRVDADEALRLRNRAIELSLDGIVIASCIQAGSPILYVNPGYERITGYSAEEARQRAIADLIEDATDPAAAQPLWQAMAEQREGRAILRSVRKDGALFWNEVRLAVVRDRGGGATHFVFTMSDITKARDAEEQLELLASHDVLTGLPNRRMLMDRMGQAIAMGERGNFQVAVAFIDLDRLKYVNDNLGHEAGDLLLRTVAARMNSFVRKSDTLARLGGDEFVLVSLHTTDVAVRAHVAEMLQRVQELLREPMRLGEEDFAVTCSIGVALYPQDGNDGEALLKHADAAMYAAKKNGRDKIEFYG